MDLNVSANSARGRRAGVRGRASMELAVNFGLEAPFFNLFDASTDEMLFENYFPLLQVRNESRDFPSYPVADPDYGR